ncbi:MAG: hypothetical protein PHX62_07690, partial [Bacilli bacterium]|nr:hypothetical protein [Bacilli bacterium]
NTSNTQTYSRTISVTTSATVSSKITAAFEVIEAEIGVSVSTSKTVSETIEVEIIPHTTVKIYGYVCNDVISNLEDKQTLQDRILFWWVDSGTETVCGTCKTYNAPGYEIIFINS